MKRILLLSFLAALLGATLPASGVGFIVVDEAHWKLVPGPTILPHHPHSPPRPPMPPPIWRPHVFAPLEVNSVKVATRIADQVAVTTVDQEFFNPNNARLEGTFIFPVPKGAQLDRFAMEIDGKKVEAELLAADKARSIYEDIVRRAKDPALLEYSGRDLFKVRIFPIEPNSKKRITLRYTQLLKADTGLIAYEMPLNTAKYSSKPIKSVSVKLDLETKRSLKSIYSPSHAVEIKRDGPNRATVGYEGSDVSPDTDFALYFSPEKDEVGINLLTHRVAGEDGFFLLLASPGVDVKENNLVKKDVVFVLDTSGSMAGKKLEQAKKAMLFCVENLNDGDRFEIARFSTEVEPLFDKLVAADKANREKANSFIQGLKPIGGTAIDDALRKALSYHGEKRKAESGKAETDRPLVVIFLTDGLPTIGTTDEEQILASVKRASGGNVRIFCFGIGTDVNTHLLDNISEATRATSQYVLPDEDLEVKLSNFYAKIKEPVLANPSLKFTGDIRTTKLYPSALPDLFKGEQLVLVGRYSGKGSSAAVIEGSVNGASHRFATDVKFPDESSDNDFIPRLWATRRVGYLLDEIRLRGESAELKDEVTDLARKFGLVTPYTAYLILEDEAKRGVPVALQSMPQLREQRVAMDAMKDLKTRYESDRSGGLAVNSARANQAFKQADNYALSIAGYADANRSLSYTAPAAPAGSGFGGNVSTVTATSVMRSDSPTMQNSQFVNGRNFYNNGSQWVDSQVQQTQTARRVRMQFNSKEYFAFAATNAAARPWLALGNNVQFVLKDTVYEIYD